MQLARVGRTVNVCMRPRRVPLLSPSGWIPSVVDMIHPQSARTGATYGTTRRGCLEASKGRNRGRAANGNEEPTGSGRHG
jgi:hypothetical protein